MIHVEYLFNKELLNIIILTNKSCDQKAVESRDHPLVENLETKQEDQDSFISHVPAK